MRGNVTFLVDDPEAVLETSLKGQMVVSEVLGRQHFNTEVS